MAEMDDLDHFEDANYAQSLRRSLGRTSFGERRRSAFMAKEIEMRDACAANLSCDATKLDNFVKTVEIAVKLALKNLMLESDEDEKETMTGLEEHMLGKITSILTKIEGNTEVKQALQEDTVGLQHLSLLQKRTKALQDEESAWKAYSDNQRKLLLESREKNTAARCTNFVVDDSQAAKLSPEASQFLKAKPNYNSIVEKLKEMEDRTTLLHKGMQLNLDKLDCVAEDFKKQLHLTVEKLAEETNICDT